MKKLKFKFNSLLRKYLRYTKKLQRFRLTGRNEYCYDVLEEYIQKLENVDKLWLSIKNETYNLGNTTLVGFTNNATTVFDTGYDSPR